MKIGAILFAAATATALVVGSANAQSSRTFVSGQGFDTGTCALAAPCRSFGYAVTQTASGGEIIVLDSAGYGPVTINKAITITSPVGIYAGVTAVASGDGITITAGASDVVILRGLTIEGNGSGPTDLGPNGINFMSGAELDVQNCIIRGFTGSGIATGLAGSGILTVTDTIVSTNGRGINVQAQSGSSGDTKKALFVRTQALGNGVGILAVNSTSGAVHVTVVDSVVAGNVTGIGANGNLGANDLTTLILDNTTVSLNRALGIFAAQGSTIYLQRTAISKNVAGYEQIGTIKSFGNNAITDTTNFGVITPIALQ
jgi:hypothetical protein